MFLLVEVIFRAWLTFLGICKVWEHRENNQNPTKTASNTLEQENYPDTWEKLLDFYCMIITMSRNQIEKHKEQMKAGEMMVIELHHNKFTVLTYVATYVVE